MKIACIMCTWEERQMVPLAIESSKGFVDRYIVVDKASGDDTVRVIEECAEKWELDVDIYIRSDLLLREARMFAIEKADEEWILIQDGDEVFHTDGPNRIFNLRKFLKYRNIVFQTPMTVLAGDFLHTDRVPPTQPPHAFLYHNNHSFYLPKDRGDIPLMMGVLVPLSRVYKFNCWGIKSPRRIFLRQYWSEWCRTTNAFMRYASVEEYVKAKLDVEELDEHVEKWYNQLMIGLEPYDKTRYGYYPKVIREYIKVGKVRGYENDR
ncbi:MAG: glycosyltransferase [Candidatus Bathyarchaeia archaeon]